MSPRSKCLWVLSGPTASGKSALAIELAERIDAEIVSADSQQVYRYFAIGTAKPSAADLKHVPHHLISVVEPDEAFSAARFQALADEAIADIWKRGRSVLVVGGTGLYLRVLLRGIVGGVGTDAALRQELEKLSDEELLEKLKQVDEPSARQLPKSDRVRMIRALEIHRATGVAASTHRKEHGFQNERYSHRLWVLVPERDSLYERINQRTQAMFHQGLISETAHLIERGFGDSAAMRCVGYRQAKQVLMKELSEERAVELTAQATRNYAKRQFTWFKKEPSAEFLKGPVDVDRLVESVSQTDVPPA